jgi:hypothetical protein
MLTVGDGCEIYCAHLLPQRDGITLPSMAYSIYSIYTYTFRIQFPQRYQIGLRFILGTQTIVGVCRFLFFCRSSYRVVRILIKNYSKVLHNTNKNVDTIVSVVSRSNNFRRVSVLANKNQIPT